MDLLMQKKIWITPFCNITIIMSNISEENHTPERKDRSWFISQLSFERLDNWSLLDWTRPFQTTITARWIPNKRYNHTPIVSSSTGRSYSYGTWMCWLRMTNKRMNHLHFQLPQEDGRTRNEWNHNCHQTDRSQGWIPSQVDVWSLASWWGFPSLKIRQNLWNCGKWRKRFSLHFQQPPRCITKYLNHQCIIEELLLNWWIKWDWNCSLTSHNKWNFEGVFLKKGSSLEINV